MFGRTHGGFDEDDIENIVVATSDLETAGDRLIEHANENEGTDNVSDVRGVLAGG